MKRSIFSGIGMVVAAAVFCARAYSQDPLSSPPVLCISLDEVIRRAVETSETLQIKEKQLDKSRGMYRETRAGLLPHVSASGTWTHNKEYPVTAEKTDYAMEGGISASQVLWSFGKVLYAVNSARNAVDVTRLNREAGEQEVIYAAKLCYYSTLLARNSLDVTEKSYANALANKKIMAERSYGGRSSKYEIIRMNAEVASRVPTVNEARTQFVTAVETLKKLIDADPDSRVELRGEFRNHYERLEFSALVKAMYEREPSLKSLEKSVAAAEALVKSNRAGFLPTLSAFGSLSRAGGSNKRRFLDNGETDRSASVGLKVSVPIWEGGTTEAQLRQAEADRSIALLTSKQVNKDLLLELKKAYLEYQQYIGNLAANTEAVRLAAESFQQAQEMFSSGQISLTDLNDAELLLTNQRLNKEMTLFSINSTLAKIEKLIAGRYPERKIDE